MEAEFKALVQSCCKLFLIIDGVIIMGKAIGPPVGNSTIQVLINKDNGEALVLAETLLSIYTSQNKHYHTKTLGFENRLQSMGSSCF